MVPDATSVKLLVFAHTPPPHHGQSYMVQRLLGILGGDRRGRQGARPELKGPAGREIECYHVDARFSDRIEAVGRFQFRKGLLILKYCAAAIGCRLRFGVKHFYYVPAPPGLRPALYRDFIVMAVCRPFFPQIIYHWHAAGLGDWLETHARPWERWLGRTLLARPALSIVQAQFNRRDGEQLASHRIAVVPYGIPDPCPRFEEDLQPRHHARAEMRRRLREATHARADETPQPDPPPTVFQVLYLGLCCRAKGLFDAIEAVAMANRTLRSTPLRVRLAVAGTFWIESERAEFDQRIRQSDLTEGGPAVEYRGFVAGEDKARLMRESDCLCFPTYYPAESFGLVLVEAMAFGLPVVTTTWRMIPELLPPGYPGLVPPQSPARIADALLALLQQPYDPSLRAHFLAHFTDGKFAEAMKAVLGGAG
jgi:glycosyltransferase involved in cell wall biosynthesis